MDLGDLIRRWKEDYAVLREAQFKLRFHRMGDRNVAEVLERLDRDHQWAISELRRLQAMRQRKEWDPSGPWFVP